MSKTLFTILLISISSVGFAQLDTIQLKSFLEKQTLAEENFINHLKVNELDECLKFFSSEVISKMGQDKLKVELKKLNEYFAQYPNPYYNSSIGLPTERVGTFGYDSHGYFEKECFYRFENERGKVVYHFSLYFDSENAIGEIKHYKSKGNSEFNLKKIAPIGPRE